MRWFGFGFNAFGQIRDDGEATKEGCSETVKGVNVLTPTELTCHVAGRERCSSSERKLKACWSRRASVHLDGK